LFQLSYSREPTLVLSLFQLSYSREPTLVLSLFQGREADWFRRASGERSVRLVRWRRHYTRKVLSDFPSKRGK